MWRATFGWRFLRSAKIRATSSLVWRKSEVVGGVNPPSGRAAQSLYAQVVRAWSPVSSTRAAEMAKLLENIFPVRKHRPGERAQECSVFALWALISGK